MEVHEKIQSQEEEKKNLLSPSPGNSTNIKIFFKFKQVQAKSRGLKTKQIQIKP